MKLNKTIVGVITSIAVIGVLLIPSLTIYELDNRTTKSVYELQGLYVSGTEILLKDTIDKTENELQFSNEVIVGSFPNNDSYIYADNNIIKEMYYVNWITYIGNGTYSVNSDFSQTPFSITPLEWNLGFPLDINGTSLTEFDFIKLTMTGQSWAHPSIFKVWIWPPFLDTTERVMYPIDLNTKPLTHIETYTLTYVEKGEMDKMFLILGYEWDLYFQFQCVPYIPESSEFGNGNFTFKIEGFNFIDEHQLLITNDQFVYLAIGSSIAIMTTSFVLSRANIDLDIKSRRKKN